MTQDPISTQPDTDIVEVARVMTQKRIRCMPVVGRDGRLRGLVSRDAVLYAHQQLPRTRLHTRQLVAAQVMERDVPTLSVDDSAYDAAQILLESRVECIAILDRSQRVVGLLTETDFVRFAMRRSADSVAA